MGWAGEETASLNSEAMCPAASVPVAILMWAKKYLSVEQARAKATESNVAFKGFLYAGLMPQSGGQMVCDTIYSPLEQS